MPSQESKPAWKILRVLANFLELDGFDYADRSVLQSEIESVQRSDAQTQLTSEKPWQPLTKGQLQRYAYTPIYSVDAMVRRSEPLAQTPWAEVGEARMNTHTLNANGLQEGCTAEFTQGESSITLPVVKDDRLADDVVAIPSATQRTAGWGTGHQPISVKEVSC